MEKDFSELSNFEECIICDPYTGSIDINSQGNAVMSYILDENVICSKEFMDHIYEEVIDRFSIKDIIKHKIKSKKHKN